MNKSGQKQKCVYNFVQYVCMYVCMYGWMDRTLHLHITTYFPVIYAC